MELSDILNKIYPLPAESLQMIMDETERIVMPKGQVFISSSENCRQVFFIGSGLVRAFYLAKGREITFWIGDEGSVALSMQSYVNNQPGYETIATVEESELWTISVETLNALYSKDINLANWGRKFAEQEILRAEKSLIPQLFTTGKERYKELLRDSRNLINRVPQEILASYLGLTPVSLSRIRHQIAKE